jgi:hypothetical protein
MLYKIMILMQEYLTTFPYISSMTVMRRIAINGKEMVGNSPPVSAMKGFS